MWPFKRKKLIENKLPVPACPHCGSKNIRVVSSDKSEQPDYIKVWRGQRYVKCRCLDCGRDFNTGELAPELAEKLLTDENMVSDEDELQAAEEALKKQADEEGDHRFKSGF
jgi:transcriptional regulator NrdR family protein